MPTHSHMPLHMHANAAASNAHPQCVATEHSRSLPTSLSSYTKPQEVGEAAVAFLSVTLSPPLFLLLTHSQPLHCWVIPPNKYPPACSATTTATLQKRSRVQSRH